MARKRATPVVLDDGQIETLAKISRDKSQKPRLIQRAKVLLLAAKGQTDDKIASFVGLNKNSVRNTIGKFTTMGLQAALTDLARSGRPAAIEEEAKQWVRSLASQRPIEHGYDQPLWTIQKLTSHVRSFSAGLGYAAMGAISTTKIWMILQEKNLEPHQSKYYLERHHAGIVKKKDVLMIYKGVELALSGQESDLSVSWIERPEPEEGGNVQGEPPEEAETAFAAREREGQRASSDSQSRGAGLEGGGQEPESLSLLAGLNLNTGQLIGLVREGLENADFIEFLKAVSEQYPRAGQIKIVLGNHGVHTSKETRKYLQSNPGRFDFVFVPKHGAWLNLIESLLDRLTRVWLKEVKAVSKTEAVKRIYQYLADLNAEPMLNRWPHKADDLEL
ncbi:MAG: IS630 family transposase [Deltaproteobacteria bacterium]|jgi:transposase|nr:IS630 family transposase [Deltaproteobacteria bacterium]